MSSGALLSAAIGRRREAALRRVGRLAARRGLRAFLVGGVVRDAFLGLRAQDLDVVVEGPIESLAREIDPRAVLHATFLTATVEVTPGVRVDLARARTERYPAPGALPRVEPATIEQDLLRRDFSVNALALDVRPRRFGRLLDPLGGRADLRARSLRVLHDRSFLDDPTRTLRAVRLAARLRLRLTPRTARLLREATRARALATLSPARLRGQLDLLLAEQEPRAALRLLSRHGLLGALAAELVVTPELRSCLARLPALLAWYRTLPGATPVEHTTAVLATVLGALPTAPARRAARRLARTGREEELLAGTPRATRELLVRLARPGLRPSRIRRVCAKRPPEQLLVALAHAGPAVAGAALRCHLERLAAVRTDIDGRDLLRAGVAAGPRVARGLAAALAAKLDGRAPERPDQLRVALAAARRA